MTMTENIHVQSFKLYQSLKLRPKKSYLLIIWHIFFSSWLMFVIFISYQQTLTGNLLHVKPNSACYNNKNCTVVMKNLNFTFSKRFAFHST